MLSAFLKNSDLPGRKQSSSEENIRDKNYEAGGDGDGDQGKILHQLELDDVLHVGHR